MKQIQINSIEDLQKLDLSNFRVMESVEIQISIRLEDQEIEYPIRVVHKLPGLESKVRVRAALFGKSKLKMPVEIHVNSGAVDTSTNFKALIYILSDKSHADVTPGLYIHEKDIMSAGHGVVIKNIKEKDLRYLRSRGIREDEAKEMIINIK